MKSTMLLKALCTTLATAVLAGASLAQTAPAVRTLPVSDNFGTVDFGTAPTGYAGWNGLSGGTVTSQTLAENSAPTGNALFNTTFPNASGGLYGDDNGGDARVVVVTSSNATNGVNQLVLAIDTTGQANIVLTCDFINAVANLRTIGCVIQYRIGQAGAWTSVLGTNSPYIQSGGTVGAISPASVTLPVAAEGQAEVQIRFAVWRGTEAGSSSAFAIDNVSILGGGQDPTGSCCIGQNCTTTTEINCGGTWTQGQACDNPNPCIPPPVGGCCINGVCLGVFTQAECTATPNATWTEGVDCNNPEFPCPRPTGTCCVGTTCTIETDTQCANLGGTWSLGGFCSAFFCTPDTGACCLPNQMCIVTGPADCETNQGGIYMGRTVTCESISCIPTAPTANLVAKFDFSVNRAGVGNNLTFTQTVDAPGMSPFLSAGDSFRTVQRFNGNVPFTLVDDSLSIFTLDVIGIVGETKLDKWFGANDLLNNENASGMGQATWTFDISGYTALSLSIDMGAMGDFEASAAMGSIADAYTFSVSIDGGTPVAVFTIVPDEAASVMYTLEGGAVITLDDPIVVNGTTTLNNIFQTLSAAVAGTGSTLTLTLDASNDSDEGFAFDNICINGTLVGGGDPRCCFPDGTCMVQPTGACELQGGTPGGPGTVCDPNTCPQPSNCPSDFNMSGGSDVPDIFAFLANWFGNVNPGNPYTDCAGTVHAGVPAIFAFLADWFAGCPCP